MERTPRALVNAAFTFAQFGFALVIGVFLTPFVIAQIGSRTYGIWLAVSEVFAYLALTDLGVFAVLPWLIAQAGGAKTIDQSQRAVASSLVVGLLIGGLILAAGAGIWFTEPSWLFLYPEDRELLFWPVTLMALCAALAFPTQVFSAVLAGKQDFAFTGALGLARSAVATGLTVTLVYLGHGLYGLALAGLPVALAGVVVLARVATRYPDQMFGLPRPTCRDLGWLLQQGFPGWMSGFGHRLVTASYGILLMSLGSPEWVVVYYCTAKAHLLLQNITWIFPDSGLIGLAELYGEKKTNRIRELVQVIILMNLFLAGAAMCGLFALNALFVRRWVGSDLFGGHGLNIALTLGFLLAGFVHGMVTSLSVTGCQRFRLGTVLLANGVLSIVLSVGMVWAFGLVGCAWAPILAAIPTTLVYGLWELGRLHDLTPGALLTGIIWPWARASSLPLAGAVAVGLLDEMPAGLTILGTAGCCICYCLAHRRTISEFPIPVRVRSLLSRVYLIAPPRPTSLVS